jgi:hypothetical protein
VLKPPKPHHPKTHLFCEGKKIQDSTDSAFMKKYSTKDNVLINKETGTIVKTTGIHGDKTMKYQFEGYRMLDNGEWSSETEINKFIDFYQALAEK